MAGLGIRLFTDEMINTRLASLNGQGYDIETTQGAGRSNQKVPDDAQLAYATQQGRAIFTFNAREFADWDRRWKAQGRRHAGIVVSEQITDLDELIRRVKQHLDTVWPSEQDDKLLALAP